MKFGNSADVINGISGFLGLGKRISEKKDLNTVFRSFYLPFANGVGNDGEPNSEIAWLVRIQGDLANANRGWDLR
ncbi:MAG: hypothetical protein PHO29_02860 [Acetobacterium sp.]|nr:hypothetical protein [Acetobacterium sp.]